MITFLILLSFLSVNSFSPKYDCNRYSSFINHNILNNEQNMKSLLKSIWNDYDNDLNKPNMLNQTYYDDNFDKSIFKNNLKNKKKKNKKF